MAQDLLGKVAEVVQGAVEHLLPEKTIPQEIVMVHQEGVVVTESRTRHLPAGKDHMGGGQQGHPPPHLLDK